MIKLHNIRYSYGPSTPHWKIDTLELSSKESCFVYGPSGVGKSTFLQILAGLKPLDSGEYTLGDCSIGTLSAAQCDKIRGERMGYVFQLFNLVPYLSVLDNIMLPVKLCSKRPTKQNMSWDEDVSQITKELKIGDLLAHKVSQLSVGQAQRVACARALIGSPDLILCDEPTSALDQENSNTLVSLLLELSKAQDSTLIFVSHDQTLSNSFDRKLSISDWRVS